ncbi:hypothetical protein PMZ80_010800 [Knufia obscura]|uniref:Uncharacterized protein n=2 Tax=Knufia TaxID=430999 RepID=A0AAN8E7F2_9EURO|nr:hypothetical protein PMZ80_010800 [Knufia obscura]KAK5947844.1 hypothetical protein OHC33_011109 [Knufia fluminis]
MSDPSGEFKDSSITGTERANQPDTAQNDYVSRTGQSEIKVQSDEAAVEAGGYEDPAKADSDKQLQADEKDAIDQSNIINERTRGAAKNYQEPGDTEGLGAAADGSDGRSRVAGGPA